MKDLEYLRIQEESSEWTRENPVSQLLVKDMVGFFAEHVGGQRTVLEVGCGDGFALDLLRDAGYTVIGCDLNIGKLRTAKRSGHSVSAHDAHTLGFRTCAFDAIYCTHTLEHTHDGYRVLQDIARLLRPGGLLFVVVPDHKGLYGETYVPPEGVIPLAKRAPDHFAKLLYKRTGVVSNLRNQFPFSMRLLLSTLFNAELEVQWAERIERDGPELWAIAEKPADSDSSVAPLMKRQWRRSSVLQRSLAAVRRAACGSEQSERRSKS